MEIKKENFKRIANSRVDRIINTISQLTNLSNPSYYEYTDEEIEEMFSKIRKNLEDTEKYLINANERKKYKKLKL